MNALDFRSSQSSYGDPRHFSAASYGAPQPPPTKVLLDGYRNELGPGNGEKSMYNALNSTSPPRRSIPPSANDPVAMYLLTETAMGDSMNYEVLSVEEVEGLKKELRVLSSRTNATKRKLTLELKLRDAAMSLSRLHNNEGYDDGSENDADPAKTNEELALSNRRCEELSMDIWHSEHKVQEIQKRLLEHTAGVLQLTHKGLKKNLKNGIPHTPEIHHDGPEAYGMRTTQSDGLSHKTSQETERKLTLLSSRLRDLVLQSAPDSEYSDLPQPSGNGDLDAHIRYIENGLEILGSQPKAEMRGQGLDHVSEQQLVEMSQHLLSIMENPDLPRAQTLPPAPNPSGAALAEHLTYLSVGITGLESRVDKLLEQKSILTTQIQQQRELNSKSDAERDAKISDLIEELAHSKKELELAERQEQQSKDDLDTAMKELEDVRQELTGHREMQMQNNKGLEDSETQAREHAEAEIARLQNIIHEIQGERDEHHEARNRVESEVTRLLHSMEEIQREKDEHLETRNQIEGEVARLQDRLEEVQREKDKHLETRNQIEGEVARLQERLEEVQREKDEHLETRNQIEGEVARLQDRLEEVQREKDEHQGARTEIESEVARLQERLEEVQREKDEHDEARAHVESEFTLLQNNIDEIQREKTEHFEARSRVESEIAHLQNMMEEIQREKMEHQEARARVEGEVARLQGVIDQLNDSAESRESAEQQIAQLEETIQQIRNDADMRVKKATDMHGQADAEIHRLQEAMNDLREELESRLNEANESRAQAEGNAARLQKELTDLEGDVVRAQTELTMAKAELDGAYGTRAQRAAEAAIDPALLEELDVLKARNFEMAEELAGLKAGKPGTGDVQNRVQTLEKELRETVDDYEAMTKASIEFERERERFESMIDSLRDRCEQLETQINEERISWMGSNNSASSMGRDGPYETTSTMVLKNEFKKMMRDTRAENMKILKAEHEERRRLEAIIRELKKEQANMSGNPALAQTGTAL